MLRKLVFLSAVGLLLTLLSPVQAQEGTVLFEFWFDGGITGEIGTLLSDARYPYGPDLTEYMDSFTANKPDQGAYGGRGRAYLTPPETGEYTFWVWSDGDSRLYLGTDEDPANAVLVASVSGGTGAGEWTKYPTQKSEPKALEAGKRYYIEGIYTGTNIGVGWTGPGIVAEEPSIPEPNVPEPNVPEPNVPEPNVPEPNVPEPNVPEPNVPDPNVPDPNVITLIVADDPNVIDPNVVDPNVIDPNVVDPNVVEQPVIIAGQYLSAFVVTRHPAYAPIPANGAVGVTSSLLQWSPGTTAVLHDVYFGTDPNVGIDTYRGRVELSQYDGNDPLISGGTYFWRIDEIEADGVTMHIGDIWSFTAGMVKATGLSPYDGAVCRNLDTQLSWIAGEAAVSHDVYFDVNEANVVARAAGAFLGNQADAAFDPNGLATGTTYFWCIDEVQADGVKIPGDIVRFTTLSEGVHGVAREVWYGIAGVAVSDLTSNPKFPDQPDELDVVQEFEAPTDVNDNYGQRLRAWLTVPAAGDYTFWVASDAASELWLGADEFSAAKIAAVETGTAPRAFDVEAGQESAPIHLEAGTYFLMALMKEGSDGDNLSVAWQGGPVAEQEVILRGFLEPYVALWATAPSPADGAGDIPYLVTLTWKAGVKAAAHNVYLGTDKNAVANATPDTAGIFKGQVTDAAFTTAALAWSKTYYWRVDEVNDAEADSPWIGHVFSFSVPGYVPLITAPETLDYDNAADPFVSEAAFDIGLLKDFTVGGVTSLQLDVQGGIAKASGSPSGTFTLRGNGSGIAGNGDEFRYAYKSLTGAGSIVARVVAIGEGSNAAAQGGVMIRASLATGSAHAMMALTTGGISFQWRTDPNGASASSDVLVIPVPEEPNEPNDPNVVPVDGNDLSLIVAQDPNEVPADGNTPPPFAPPYWVKIQRDGNDLSAFVSADGVEWTQVGAAQTIVMTDPVLIGLPVSSNAAGELREFTFDSIATTGEVAGDWQLADIGVAQSGNDPAPLYVKLVDSAGAVKAVAHPGNPNVVISTDWNTWKILLSNFSGVNLKDIAQVIVGVGDGKAGGTGSIQFNNVRLVKPITVTVANASFEEPGTADKYWYLTPELARSLGSLPGWSTDKATTKTGFIKNAEPTKGKWSAYISSGNPLWQLTDHVIIEGEVFQLDIDALVIEGGVRSSNNLKMSLYYLDDAGKRVTIGSASSSLPYDPQPRSLTVSASSVRKCIGRKVGIEFSNLRSDNVIGVDNVRLKVK